ncbi:MAG TPA: toll/interleukin-1 receptor domain-containing protein [Pyrinomonadaceae bacterium]|nr:toll/interleukin-1 receptor domain-containing protein [Pyrinomonadaceae bacterium]
MTNQDFKYWAFISYSHADEEWAKWLHKSIETYRVPRKLVGRATSNGMLPRRIFPVFRDRDELPGASDLGGKIQEALKTSRSLIVVCSPKSAVSKWVNEEVKAYKALGRADHVLCLMIDGEPNAAPDSGLLECFPRAVRFEVGDDGELTEIPAEPIAADARPGKDGKTNALFKLLSGMMGVGYDELRQREKQRQRQRQLRRSALVAAVLLLSSTTYMAVADAGLNVPAGQAIRTFLDRHDKSLMRRAHSDTEIRAAAASHRRELTTALEHGQTTTLKPGQTSRGWIAATLKPGAADPNIEYWSNAQALSALFTTVELSDDEARQLLAGLDVAFEPNATVEGSDGRKYGWIAHPKEMRTQAEPALWTAVALANALGRPGLLTGEARERALKNFGYTQEILKTYRPDNQNGWNMFPNQEDPHLHNVYTTALALLALLETRKANLAWDGSFETRDQLLMNAARWLAERYDAESPEPGWRHAASETSENTVDGLTLQIYGELLRAEAEAGFVIPPKILEQMPDYLSKCGERNLSFPNDSGEFAALFTDHRGQHYMAREALGFMWYPWAINAAQLWLLHAARVGEPMDKQVSVRRALGHLVVDHGDEAIQKFKSEWTFQAAETLYGLAAIPRN